MVPASSTSPSTACRAGRSPAYEELRVADDELRAQLDQIEALEQGRADPRPQLEQLLSVLPVPAFTTDGHGVVRHANAAAAALLTTRQAAMTGKPALTFFALDDRSSLRSRLSTLAREGTLFAQQTTVLTRRGTQVPVEVTVSSLPGPGTDVCWIMLADTERETLATPARDHLPSVLVRLAALPSSTETVQELLTRAVVLCQVALGTDVDLSVSLGSPVEPDAVASTDVIAQHLDGVQLRHAEGPCVDAFDSGVTVVTQDVRTDPRWPGISEEVPGVIGAVVAVSLVGGGRRIGAPNVYRTRIGTDAALVDTTELLATTISALLHEHALKAELRATASGVQRALASRAAIDQAKGIVMADRSCTADEAFQHLVRLASEQEIKVRDVARLLVESHGRPPA
jgi:PAS domain S-box-containing protein